MLLEGIQCLLDCGGIFDASALAFLAKGHGALAAASARQRTHEKIPTSTTGKRVLADIAKRRRCWDKRKRGSEASEREPVGIDTPIPGLPTHKSFDLPFLLSPPLSRGMIVRALLAESAGNDSRTDTNRVWKARRLEASRATTGHHQTIVAR